MSLTDTYFILLRGIIRIVVVVQSLPNSVGSKRLPFLLRPGGRVEARAASGAFVAGLAEDGEAHGADVADIDAPLVAEARGAEVDPLRARHLQKAPRVDVYGEHGEQVLQQTLEGGGKPKRQKVTRESNEKEVTLPPRAGGQ